MVEKIDSPIGDENTRFACLYIQTHVEKIDSPIGDENCFQFLKRLLQIIVEKIDSPIGDENTGNTDNIIFVHRRENRFPDRGRELSTGIWLTVS